MLTTQGLTAPSNPERCKSVCTEPLRTRPRHGTAAAGSLSETVSTSRVLGAARAGTLARTVAPPPRLLIGSGWLWPGLSRP